MDSILCAFACSGKSLQTHELWLGGGTLGIAQHGRGSAGSTGKSVDAAWSLCRPKSREMLQLLASASGFSAPRMHWHQVAAGALQKLPHNSGVFYYVDTAPHPVTCASMVSHILDC